MGSYIIVCQVTALFLVDSMPLQTLDVAWSARFYVHDKTVVQDGGIRACTATVYTVHISQVPGYDAKREKIHQFQRQTT